jgi:hypothetical protein
MIILDPIMTGAHGTTVPPATDRAKAVLASGAQRHKRPRIATRRSTQVTTQIELPPYYGP